MLQSLQCAHSRKRVIEDINDTQSVSGKVPSVGDYGPNTYADSDDNTCVIVEVDRGLWDAQKYYEEEDLHTHRSTDGHLEIFIRIFIFLWTLGDNSIEEKILLNIHTCDGNLTNLPEVTTFQIRENNNT